MGETSGQLVDSLLTQLILEALERIGTTNIKRFTGNGPTLGFGINHMT